MPAFVRKFVWTLIVVLVGTVHGLVAAEIVGKVSVVEEKTIMMTTSSELLPVAGDKLVIFVEIKGIGKVQVGEGVVRKVAGNSIAASVEKTSSRIVVGQFVTIDSPKPVQQSGKKVPILVGRTAADAKEAVE